MSLEIENLDKDLDDKISAAHTAVNNITWFALFVGVFSGFMLGVVNSEVVDADIFDNITGFSIYFFGIAVPFLILKQLMLKAIAQAGIFKQVLVWLYSLVLFPLFPMGTITSSVILFAQVSWMRKLKR